MGTKIAPMDLTSRHAVSIALCDVIKLYSVTFDKWELLEHTGDDWEVACEMQRLNRKFHPNFHWGFVEIKFCYLKQTFFVKFYEVKLANLKKGANQIFGQQTS